MRRRVFSRCSWEADTTYVRRIDDRFLLASVSFLYFFEKKIVFYLEGDMTYVRGILMLLFVSVDFFSILEPK